MNGRSTCSTRDIVCACWHYFSGSIPARHRPPGPRRGAAIPRPILVARARQLTGRSGHRRVSRSARRPAITSARASPPARCWQRAHVAEIGNTDLATLATRAWRGHGRPSGVCDAGAQRAIGLDPTSGSPAEQFYRQGHRHAVIDWINAGTTICGDRRSASASGSSRLHGLPKRVNQHPYDGSVRHARRRHHRRQRLHSNGRSGIALKRTSSRSRCSTTRASVSSAA